VAAEITRGIFMAPMLQSAFGFVAILLLAWLASENRRVVAWRTVISGIALQIVFAAALLKLAVFKQFFLALNDALLAIEKATQAGTSFVFGYIGGAPLPFAETGPGSSFSLAFRALPIILVISALSSLLFYWRVLPWIVRAISRVLEKSMGVGGAVGLSTAANIFVGMVEAPLFIRPYLAQLSRGELFIVMTCGMAGIAGTVMVIYASILGPVVPDALGHILIASIISAPAAIVISVLMVPLSGAPTSGELVPAQQASSSMDAITHGTLDGLALLLNIIALLVVLVSLVTLANLMLEALPAIGGKPISLQRMLGVLLAARALGVADRRAIERGAGGWRAARHQDHTQRVHRLYRPRAPARRHAVAQEPHDHDLCAVRLRQLRQPRHPDRGTRDDGAAAPRRGRSAWIEVDRCRHARDLHDRRGRRHVLD
jgi:CNT family concentrative nucleoside transporter